MNRQLRERRDRAAERHDAALARFPTRQGATFQRELNAVVDDLTAIARAADTTASDPVEVAKIYRWLGDAYFDLGLGKDQQVLTRGSQAYQRADELLMDAPAPVEKAKLDFNYGNTLRGLSGGFDVGLLEAAQTRYESAARTFRSHHLPDLAVTVAEQLRAIDPQLRLARKYAGTQKGYGRLEELRKRLKTSGAVEREQVARELKKLNALPGQGEPQGALTEALDAIREQHDDHPERFGDEGETLRSLEQQIGALGKKLEESQTPNSEAAPPQDPATPEAIARALLERIKKESAEGKVSSERATRLADTVKHFTSVMSEGDDDLASMAARTHKMREITQRLMDSAMSPSWSTPDPVPGSRAFRAVSIIEPLKRHLLAEKGRGMLPSEESAAGTDLLTRLLTLEARIREVARDERQLEDAEGETWRLAIAVQEHARRYHVMLAQPIFASARSHAKPRSIFVSGGDASVAAARQLEQRERLQLFSGAHRGDRPRERWNQLCSASTALFDVGVPRGASRAQVCYELGLALALGKPCVVAARPRQRLPFNVNLQPIRLTGDARRDADAVMGGIEQALGTIVWGGGEAGLGRGPDDALAWLDQRFGGRLSEGSLKIAMDLARSSRDDAVAFQRSLDQLLGMLGADAPAKVLPAWPPAFPDPSAKPHLFHVMPFRPKWATPTRDLAKAECVANGWTYARGDEAEEQRVIRGIWGEIARASAVLIDITGLNPNVALELGLVHALGRPYRIVAQGNAEKSMFPSLEKTQIHRYQRGSAYPGFADEVSSLLAANHR